MRDWILPIEVGTDISVSLQAKDELTTKVKNNSSIWSDGTLLLAATPLLALGLIYKLC